MLLRRSTELITREVFLLIASIRACAKRKDICRGIQLHHGVVRRGLAQHCSNALILMYARCGKLVKAEEFLLLHSCRDVVAWTSLIAGYVAAGQGGKALDCFDFMQEEGILSDAASSVCALQACGSIRAIGKGREIHGEIARRGLARNSLVLSNALIDMYAKCGDLIKSQAMLKALCRRNIVSWNALIAGYAQHGQGEQALDHSEQMQCEGLLPDAVTFACILKACASIGALDKGEKFHDDIVRKGLLKTNNVMLGSALVDMYAKCGALLKAQSVLQELPDRDVVCWSALIAGYVEKGQGIESLKCYEQMLCDGLSPNTVTYLCILKACGSIKDSERGEEIHEKITRAGLLKHDIILGNALVDMYVKCGLLLKAEQVLYELPVRNVSSWNSLISGFAEQGDGKKAMNCYERMLEEGLSPSVVTFSCVLRACGSMGATDKGGEIHNEIARQGLLGYDAAIGNASIEMYAKCGALTKAKEMLDELHFVDVASWNALIAVYAQQGQIAKVSQYIKEMEHRDLSPNASSFLCLAKAFAGTEAAKKVDQIFHAMERAGLSKNDIVVATALVDMYAKCGIFEKVQQILEDLPFRNAFNWSTLLGACQKWGDVDTGKWAFQHALQIHKDVAGTY